MRTSFSIVLAFLLAACGGGAGGGAGGGHSEAAPSGTPGGNAPPGAAPAAPTGPRTNQKSNVPLHNFADEGLNIPPFNEAARALPPEAFVEHGKEQRDPFADLYGLLAVKDEEKPQSERGSEPGSEVILLENYQLNQLTLSGIVWSAGREKALFSDPSGQPTVVMKDDRLGRGGALVKEITHDRVILELPAQEGETPKTVEFSLARASGPYQVQYEKLRADQRGIRVRTFIKPKSKEVGP